MTSKQRTVIWIGLVIVMLNLLMKWPAVKSIIFNGAGLSSPSTTPQGAGQNSGIQPTPQPNASPTPPATQAQILLWLFSRDTTL